MKLNHFLALSAKSVFSPLKIPKNRCQILRDTRNDGHYTQNLFCCLQLDPNTSTLVPGLLTDPNVMKLEKHLSTLHKYLKKGDSE